MAKVREAAPPAESHVSGFSLEAAFYLAAIGGTIWLTWALYDDAVKPFIDWVKNLLGGKTGAFASTGAVLGSAATSWGYSGATAALAPQLAYDNARSAAAAAHGLTVPVYVATYNATIPYLQDWENGDPFP